ncbi:MAG TPA: hypothetical protein VFK56_05725 [Mycobacterium sp.]|nr:hypothetical protein [Mycobacterium sp.]
MVTSAARGAGDGTRHVDPHAQRFLSVLEAPWPMFGPDRRLLSAADSRQVMVDCFAVWNEVTDATTTAAA